MHAETDRKLKSVSQQLGSIGMNNGAEDMFYNWQTQALGGEKYDIVERTSATGRATLNLIFLCTTASVIIQVKYRAHPKDIQNLLAKKPVAFRRIYNEYNHHKLYFGLVTWI